MALSLFDLDEPEVLATTIPILPLSQLGQPKGELMDDDVLAILRDVEVDGWIIKLNCPNLERGLYERVNDVLLRLGGKWKRGKGHKFPYDPTSLLAGVVGSGLMPPKNPLAFFPTPNAVILEMMGFSPICGSWAKECRFLEPSAGQGAIANLICEESGLTPDEINMDLVECDPFRASLLRGQGYKNVYEMDFLEFNPGAVYDYIWMNPPFSVKGDTEAHATHIVHAYDLLASEGVLLAVVPSGWKTKKGKSSVKLQEIMEKCGTALEVPEGAFKESGTMVNTEILYIVKEMF